MTWACIPSIYSAGLAAESSLTSSLDTLQSALLKSKTIPAAFCSSDSLTGFYQSFPLVGSASVFSGNDSPSRIVPHRGQIPKNDSKPPANKHWRVFHKRVAGSYLANDPGHLGPQSRSFPAKSRTLSRAGDVLAQLREPAAYDEFP